MKNLIAVALILASIGCGQFKTSVSPTALKPQSTTALDATTSSVSTPAPAPLPSPSGTLSSTGAGLFVTDIGSGLNRKVTVESSGQFRLVWEDVHNWGLTQWYDLVNDPLAQLNLAMEKGGVSQNLDFSEAALFQQVFYRTGLDDPKLFMRLAFFPNVPRSFSIIENSPQRVVVESTSSPVEGSQGVLTNMVVRIRYSIYPDGRIFIRTVNSVNQPQSIGEWRLAVLGLHDPTTGLCDPSTQLDSCGWIRSTKTQTPYDYKSTREDFIYAYWGKNTPAPFATLTKASIMLVPHPTVNTAEYQFRHSWTNFKRWFYTRLNVSMPAGSSVTNEYLLQLGTHNSAVLPDLSNIATAESIANQYRANPVGL